MQPPEDPPVWDSEVDFVVAGTGAGGLTGAIVAHDLGLEVVVLEKSTMVGGGAAISDGEIWVPGNHLQAKSGDVDGEARIEEYLDHLAGSFPVDKPVRRAWMVSARDAMRYLEEKAGIGWMIIPNLSDVFYGSLSSASAGGRYLETVPLKSELLGNWSDKILLPPAVPYFVTNEEMIRMGGASTLRDWPQELIEARIGEGVLCQGPGLIAHLLKACLDRTIEVHLGSPLVRLIKDASRTTGVVTEVEGKAKRIKARKGVLLNIGGYDWHPYYPFVYEHVPEWHSVMPPSIGGDLIELASDVGAVIVPFRISSPVPGYHIPGEQWFGKDLYRQINFESGLPHSLIVNRQGRRFADESYFQDMAIKASSFDKNLGFVNFPCFIILDQTYRDKYPFGSIEAGRPFPEGFGEKAQTLQELGTKLGVDVGAFLETVATFNGYAAEGTDRQFGRGSKAWSNQYVGDMRNKPNPNLGAVETPPFFGIRLTFVGIGRNGGFRIDPEGRVLDARANSVPGLYACGNCVAFTEVGPTYQDGACLSRSMAFGYKAAMNAAGASAVGKD